MIKISINKVLINILFITFVFQYAIIKFLGNSPIAMFFSYLDETIAIVEVIYLLFYYLFLNKDMRYESKIFLSLLFLNLIGFLSTVLNGKNSSFASLEDVFNCNKFVISLFFGIVITRKSKKTQAFFWNINSVSKGIVGLLFLLDLINIISGNRIFESPGIRYYINTQQLFFAHPNDFGQAILLCLFVLLFNLDYRKTNINYIFLGTFCVISTMRIRMVAFVVVMLVFYFYFYYFKIKSKRPLVYLMLLVVIIVGANQFINYYGNTYQTRNIVTIESIGLANFFFPFGVGFGNYGTNMARQNYSPYYYLLGFNEIWGLNSVNDTFLTDQFWPAVLGQFGWIGLIFFILSIWLMYKQISFFKKKVNSVIMTGLLVLIYEIITSFGETAFYNPSSFSFFFIFGVCIELIDMKSMENRKFKYYITQRKMA